MAKSSDVIQELLNSAIQDQSNNKYTLIPCVVVGVVDNLNTCVVNIQPSINQKLKDGTIKERSIILGVPVIFPCSKTSAVTFPINVGDTGLAMFSMRSLDAWKNGNGYPAAPLNFAKMDKGDAMYLPGLQPPSVSVNNPAKRFWEHNTQDTVVVHNIGQSTETEVRLLASGGIVINTNQDVEVNCENATVLAQSDISLNGNNINLTASTMSVNCPSTTWVGNITQTGNYTMTGVATFNGVIFNTHRHAPSVVPPSNP